MLKLIKIHYSKLFGVIFLSDMISFIEWLPAHAQPKSISKTIWILNSDKKEYSTFQLYTHWQTLT